jgi:hypothetical protein
MVVALGLALGLLLTPAVTGVTNVSADPGMTEWERVGTPTGEDWKLAPGTNDLSEIMQYKGVYFFAGGQIFGIALTAGGDELYVNGLFRDVDDLNDNGDVCEIVPQLLKSTDGGATWKAITSKVFKPLVDNGTIPPLTNLTYDPIRHILIEKVTCDPLDSDFVIVSLAFDDYSALYGWDMQPPPRWSPRVLVSDDGGTKFMDTGVPQQTGWWLDTTHSLATAVAVDDQNDFAITGIGTDGTNFRGIIFRFTTGLAPGYVDATRYAGWDDSINGFPEMGPFQSMAVPTVRYGMDWATHRTIHVVTVDAYDKTGTPTGDIYFQTGTWGTTKAWNAEAGFKSAVKIVDDVVIYPTQSGIGGITLPLDAGWRHASTRQAWVNVNYGDPDYGLPCYLDDQDLQDSQIGEIYKIVDGTATPIIQQIKMGGRQPWLTNVAYWGFIDSGKAVAGVFGAGYAVPYNADPRDPCVNRWAPAFTYCCEGVQVYRNDSIEDMDICCKGWKDSCKPPTGRGGVAAFYVSDTKALAMVARSPFDSGYDESALSVSFDDAETWNQLSLVDTHIDYLSDVAVSPNCNKHMLVSINRDDCDHVCCVGEWETEVPYPMWTYAPYWWYDTGGPGYMYIAYQDDVEGVECDTPRGCDSVWLMADELAEAEEYSGVWLRTWCGVLESDEGLLRLAPEEENGETVYLVDRWTDNVYWNNMETLACWEPGQARVDEITDLAVKDEATIYALDWSGDVAMSDDHGATASWEDAVDSKVNNGHTIAVKGDRVLVGGMDADVSVSEDAGETFEELKALGCGGEVHIAFDCYSDDNDTIYAAMAFGCNGIFRWVLDESVNWKDLGAEPYDYFGVVVDNPDGNPETDATTGCVLYATYVDSDENGATGVARILSPAEEVCCGEGDWSYLHMSDGCDEWFDEDARFWAEPSSLKICGCLSADSNTRLWAIDQGWYEDYYDEWTGYYGRECDYGDYCDECETGVNYWQECDCDCFGRLWTYEDCFSKGAPDLISPADNAVLPVAECYCENADFILKWDRMCNACSYDLEIAVDEEFTELVAPYNPLHIYEEDLGDAKNPSFMIPAGALEVNKMYYWRVRVADAETDEWIISWWSEVRSMIVEAFVGLELTAPDAGATNVPVSGVSFTWTSVKGEGVTYDMVLSGNADLSSPVATATGLTTTAYMFTGELAKNTGYYWQVVAKSGGRELLKSTIRTFTTAPEKPAPPPPPPAPTTPFWVWLVIGIGAVLVIVVIVLIFRTRRV